MELCIKLFAEDGDYRGEFSAVEMADSSEAREAIAEELERGGHAEVWADGQRVFDTPATSLDELDSQLAECGPIETHRLGNERPGVNP